MNDNMPGRIYGDVPRQIYPPSLITTSFKRSLRAKLLVGYLIFVSTLAGLGLWGAWRLREMGGVSGRIIRDNYDSVVAAQEMKENLERLDSMSLLILLGQRERVTLRVREYRERFNIAFTKAAGNITEPGEPEVIEDISRLREAYYEVFDALPDGGDLSDKGEGGVRYLESVEPVFMRLRNRIDDLLRMNQEAMLAKSDAARAAALRWFLQTLTLSGTLTMAGIALATWLAGRVVGPVHKLTEVTGQIAAGDFNARAYVTSQDELGTLARKFNLMADRLRHLQRIDKERLFVAEQTAEAVVNALSDPVLVLNPEGRITRLNPAAEPLFGVAAESFGASVEKTRAGEQVAAAITSALRSSQHISGEPIPLVVQGGGRAYSLRALPISDDDGRPLGAVILMEDITRIRDIQREKAAPLAAAGAELQMLLESARLGIHCVLEGAVGDLNEKQRELLESSREECEQMREILSDLLLLSRLEADKEVLRREPAHIPELLRDVVDRLRPRADAKGIKLKLEAHLDLSPAIVDRQLIERGITELINNALRHKPRGGEVSLAVSKEGDEFIAVSVSGAPTEYLPHRFDKVAPVSAFSDGGTELALSILKQIIEAHGGQVTAQSELQQGATITLIVPITYQET